MRGTQTVGGAWTGWLLQPRQRMHMTVQIPSHKSSRAFLSGPSHGNEDNRKAAAFGCCDAEVLPTSMDLFSAEPDLPLDVCYRHVEQSDYVVVILGHYYGEVPKGEVFSFTHLEINHALKRKKKLLVFFLDQDVQVHPDAFSQGKDAKKLTALKEELRQRFIITSFRSPDDLRGKVAVALQRQLKREQCQEGAARKPPEKEEAEKPGSRDVLTPGKDVLLRLFLMLFFITFLLSYPGKNILLFSKTAGEQPSVGLQQENLRLRMDLRQCQQKLDDYRTGAVNTIIARLEVWERTFHMQTEAPNNEDLVAWEQLEHRHILDLTTRIKGLLPAAQKDLETELERVAKKLWRTFKALRAKARDKKEGIMGAIPQEDPLQADLQRQMRHLLEEIRALLKRLRRLQQKVAIPANGSAA